MENINIEVFITVKLNIKKFCCSWSSKHNFIRLCSHHFHSFDVQTLIEVANRSSHLYSNIYEYFSKYQS